MNDTDDEIDLFMTMPVPKPIEYPFPHEISDFRVSELNPSQYIIRAKLCTIELELPIELGEDGEWNTLIDNLDSIPMIFPSEEEANHYLKFVNL